MGFDGQYPFDHPPIKSPDSWVLIPNDPRESEYSGNYKFLSIRRGAGIEFHDYKNEKMSFIFRKGSLIKLVETTGADNKKIFQIHYYNRDLMNLEEINKTDPDEDLV